MDESLILERLDKLSEEIKSLKSGVLDELKNDLKPVIAQASPHIMTFLSDIEGQYNNEEMAQLVKNIMLNIQNLNGLLDMLKAGMELKDDLGPVAKQALPKVTEFMAEVDGQFNAEELTNLLHKTLANLGNFNAALDMLKAGMELKDDMGPVVKQALPKVTEFMAEVDGQFDAEELTNLLRKTLANLGNFNAALDMLKAGMELKDDMGPVLKQTLPKVTEFMAELDGQFSSEELVVLLRKTLANLHNFNSALDMLKAGMELKDDLGPIIRQGWPKVMSFMEDLHEGEFQAEHLETLLRQFLLNVQTFGELMSLIKPATELVDEVGCILKQYNVYNKISSLLFALEQRGVFRVLSNLAESFKGFRCSEGQMESVCQAVSEIDLTTPSYVGPMEIMNEIRDPNVQETLGAAFKIMRAVGCCLRANRLRQVAEDYPEEFPGMSASN